MVKQVKTKFYSTEEYLWHQKQTLLGDLKGQITKHAIDKVTRFGLHPEATYKLAHLQKLKKFIALEMHLKTG